MSVSAEFKRKLAELSRMNDENAEMKKHMRALSKELRKVQISVQEDEQRVKSISKTFIYV
jgi:hypothetical protein